MSVDWVAGRYDANELDGLVEFGLRILQSRVLAELRTFLQRWVAPAVRATTRPA